MRSRRKHRADVRRLATCRTNRRPDCGRSINIRLRRLPEPAGQLAHALALLEQSTLLEASLLAGLDVDEAADAAQILESAGILETDRPLRFVHPLIRSGIYAEPSG